MNAKTIARIASIRAAADLSPASFEQRIILALKEQDRDTRHACAEAVNALKQRHDPYDRDIGGDFASWQSRAHSACMNVQAI